MKRFKWGFGIAWHVGSFFVGHSYYMVVISLTAYSLSNHFCFRLTLKEPVRYLTHNSSLSKAKPS